jgi:transcriptional regulator with PAS, ATPase and Fis domain
MSVDSTAPDIRPPREAAPRRSQHLFVVMSCLRPLDPPSRHTLEGLGEVHIGRGPQRRAVRDVDRGQHRLALTLDDTHVSTAHARISRHDDSWVLEDVGSKNGTFVNGTRASMVPLADGDCVQIGQTLLVLRTDLLTPAGTPSDLEATARTPALATLLPMFARELDLLAAVATSPTPVLLISETGTGKELLARAVHALSRRTGDFVPVNCGGLPPTLFESVLFGHKRGAFSGAIADHPGLFRAADSGTVLLDEVGDMPLGIQSALLRVLQDGEVLPVGATRPIRVDARIVAATHRDLEVRAAEGTFRDDLLARLAGYTFRLPPLRERKEDIGLITGILLREAVGGRAPKLSPDAGLALMRHDWPRNVRELEKALVHATALAGSGRIEAEHLPDSVKDRGESRRPARSEDQIQRVVRLLDENGGNVSVVASAMQTSRSQVHRLMKRLAIEPGAFRRRPGS